MKSRRARNAIFTAATLICGLIWRMAPLHLPTVAYKYGGSALWAVMVYWLIAALLPAAKVWKVAAIACLVAVAVECVRLIDTPWLDAFRLTLAGKLLLGRVFALADIACYWAAIAATAAIDSRKR